ncbi:MAG: hypothetical protein AAF675_15335 [Pseudomonadota bacterium]
MIAPCRRRAGAGAFGARAWALGLFGLVLAMAGCAEPPPPSGLLPPAAVEAGVAAGPSEPGSFSDGAEPGPLMLDDAAARAAAGARLAGLRVTLINAPEGLLDERGAGVITLRRPADGMRLRMIFVDGALALHALPPGAWRVETVAGFACEAVHILVPPVTPGQSQRPLALGAITLAVAPDGSGARLQGTVPTREDLAVLAGLVRDQGVGSEAVDARPMERGAGAPCVRRPRAVTRPDIDPTVRLMTLGEKVQLGVLLAILGAATGGAAAVGSVVFVSGAGAGVLFLGF